VFKRAATAHEFYQEPAGRRPISPLQNFRGTFDAKEKTENQFGLWPQMVFEEHKQKQG